MKTFLTLCSFAMVSAGIYGFADMTTDVRHGTMIQYDRGENKNERAVTVERLKMAQGNKSDAISNTVAKIDFKDKVLIAKPEILTDPTPLFNISDFVGQNYSRSIPTAYVEQQLFTSPIGTLIPQIDSTKIETPQAVNENAGTDQAVSVALLSSQKPIYEIPPVAVADTAKVSPMPIYEYYGRGNPGMRHKKEIVVTEAVSVADTTKAVVKKDDL